MNTKILVLAAMTALSAQSQAATKPCEELKTEIAAKLDAKNVKGYTLEIVASDKTENQQVIGSCEGGSKKIILKK